jgi:O-antigen ligase
MGERLVFGYGTSGHDGHAPARAGGLLFPAAATGPAEDARVPPATRAPERRDWAFLGLMAFTALLYFRPQDVVTPLRIFHLAELAALGALASLAFARLGRGLPITRVTPELAGVLAFGAIMLGTAPFGIWTAGAIGTFSEMYAKVILIFLLMVNTLTSPKRIEQFMWLIVVASGYIAARAVLDYARGINLIENGRVQGAVGGMFKNPNDLALNMVAVLPFAAMLVLRPLPAVRRAAAALCAVLMLAAIVASQSRSGTVGLAVMALVLALRVVRRKPGLVFGAMLAGVLALPMLPASYWQRLASITNEQLDQTGSREARSILLRESFDALVAHPLTGVGAGQFKNYNPEGRQEAWRESHNVVLQVGAELGMFGLMIFGFLLGRAAYAPVQTRRLLRTLAPARRSGRPSPAGAPLPGREYNMLDLHAATMMAALAGWFVCALFASVAYHWTFYYLLALAAAPRDYLLARAASGRATRSAAAPRRIAAAGVGA